MPKKENSNSKNHIMNNFEENNEKQNNLEKIKFGNYLEWLEQFTLKHPNFTDNDWIYLKEKITENDYENIKILPLFYEIIEKYAHENYISGTQKYYGKYYIIKKNDFYFRIGIISGQDKVIFLNRYHIIEKGFYYDIDFNYIKNNKKREFAIELDKKLDKLAELISNIVRENTPLEAIASKADETIHKILTKKF